MRGVFFAVDGVGGIAGVVASVSLLLILNTVPVNDPDVPLVNTLLLCA